MWKTPEVDAKLRFKTYKDNHCTQKSYICGIQC
jgi:hypothetical protein